MTVLRIILGDQLSLDLSVLNALDPGRDTVLMMEVMEVSAVRPLVPGAPLKGPATSEEIHPP